LCNIVQNATSEGYRAALLAAPESVRVMVLRFEQHAKHRWCEVIKLKFGFWGQLPYAFVGLFGMYMGHSVGDCTALGRRIHSMWNDCEDKSSMHRVAVEFFTTEGLVKQLVSFYEGHQDLHHFPDLFVWVFRYATLTVVGHFVEGRHRQISLHASGAASHTVPGGHSALMRRDESNELCERADFLNWAAVAWRSKDSLQKLLAPVCDLMDLKGNDCCAFVLGQTRLRPLCSWFEVGCDLASSLCFGVPRDTALYHQHIQALGQCLHMCLYGAVSRGKSNHNDKQKPNLNSDHEQSCRVLVAYAHMPV
jgi:hypothetical protein